MTEILLSVSGLSHRYAGRPALTELSFALARGETVGFLGQNGAGKSTTLALIAGLMPIQQGRITLAGHDRTAAGRAANRTLGFLPDVPPLQDDQRVEDFLRFAGALQGLKGQALSTALARELERCQLGQVRRKLNASLSKGFRQRVGLAAALLHQPPIVLLDEPSSGLDPVQQQEFRTLIRDLADHAAILLSSHQLDEVEACCSRALVLHEGRLHADLPLASLRAPSLLLALREPPALERLAALPGVLDAQALPDGRFRLELERRDPSLNQAIAREAVSHGWGLLELTPGGSVLASTFLAVTQGQSQAEIPL